MAIFAIPVLAAAALFAGQIQSIISLYPPLWNAYQKWALSTWPNVNPTLAELIELRYRNLVTPADYKHFAEQAGINEAFSEALYEAGKVLLNAQDYITLYRRGTIDEQTMRERLRAQHYSDDTINDMLAATTFYPSPGDLVRFAVREVYTPAVVQKFGQMEDLPEQFIKESFKAGLPVEQAKNYWAAHWELPSPNQGFEMYQRSIIDYDTLLLLLKSLDIMPFWRDALVKLSYNPLTRVDVRRMYGLGVLDEEGVRRAYLDIGYSPENADKLTQFTLLDVNEEMAGLSRSAVVSAYKKGILTDDQLIDYLSQLKLSDNAQKFWYQTAVYEKQMAALDDLIDEYQARYINGYVTLPEIRIELNKQDLPSNFVDSIIKKLQSKQAAKAKNPTQGDLQTWLKLGIINDTIYSSKMKKLGYQPDDIELYLSEIAKEQNVQVIKYLNIKDYFAWFTTGIINEKRFREVMAGMKLSQSDIDNKVIEAKQKMQPEGGQA